MSLVVVLPVLDPVAATACVATMSPLLRAGLFVIDQADQPCAHQLDPAAVLRPDKIRRRRYRPARNIGIARSMNAAVTRMRDTGADMLVWVSTSMRFGPDGGETIVEAAYSHDLGVVGVPAKWHAAALRPTAFDLAGLWDENFWPGYYEDTDWRRRLQLATGRPGPIAVLDLPGDARDGHGYDTLRTAMPGRLPINFDALKGYYTAKWGGCPPESVETLDRPWGDKPIGYWEPVTREDLIDRYGIGRP